MAPRAICTRTITTKFPVSSSINRGTVKITNSTEAVSSTFLRPNLSERMPITKMNPM